LSLVNRLEKRVAELESLLATSRSEASPSTQPQTVSPEQSTTATSTLAIEHGESNNEQKVAFHGSTSLFQLPGSVRTRVADTEAEKEQEDVLKRESLLNNAWRERAYEKLAITPVS
jgi:hypothetical protein